MIILGIETSCDETAISLIDISGSFVDAKNPVNFKVLGHSILSQIDIHKEYGGVYPNLAKREHSKNLIPVFAKVLSEAKFENKNHSDILENVGMIEEIKTILNREESLSEQFIKYIPTIEKPPIDAIAVTYGPGLEPALWVGISFATALSKIWNIPIIPSNHMEGHIMASLISEKDKNNFQILPANFPIIALLISGGHTELILTKNWSEYQIIGQTKDDAVGEAYDKVARMMGLPYPGGPEISKLAEIERKHLEEVDDFSGPRISGSLSQPDHEKSSTSSDAKISLPRPMIKSKDFDFSFAGLKTAVLYSLKKLEPLSDETKKQMALEFETAVTEVLISKTERAIREFSARSLVAGGGVIANKTIRGALEKLAQEFEIPISLPSVNLSTDNALMIALAGYLNHSFGKIHKPDKLKADGNLRLQ